MWIILADFFCTWKSECTSTISDYSSDISVPLIGRHSRQLPNWPTPQSGPAAPASANTVMLSGTYIVQTLTTETKKKCLKYCTLMPFQCAGQFSRYSDWLRGQKVRGSNPGGDEILHTCPDRSWGLPSLLYNGYQVFPRGVKSGRGVTLTPHPFLVPLVMKEQSYTSTPPMGRMACTEPQCLYKGDLYLYFYYHFHRAVPPSRFHQISPLLYYTYTKIMLFRTQIKQPAGSQQSSSLYTANTVRFQHEQRI